LVIMSASLYPQSVSTKPSRAPRALLALALCVPGIHAWAQSCTTTITGKVFSPLGPTAGDPIPNILVYVATTPVTAFTTAGPGSCTNPSDSVSGTPLVSTTTNAAGVFTLNSTGLAALGNTVNVVIQAGKWRRQNSVAITPCATTTVNLTMPANQSQGDLPHIAVVTGEADGVECIFRRIGISDSEFTDPNAGGSINLYEGTGTKSSGGAVANATDTTVPSEADLLENASTLNNYDLVMFGCQGTATDTIASTNTNGALDNLVTYANSGGRIFATHYGYVWLDNIQPFESSAAWTGKDVYSSGTGVIVPATINPNYAQSATLSQWLQNVGASYNNVQGQVGLYNVRVDTSAVNNPPAQSWVNLNSSSLFTGNPSVQFTFDTPINTSTTPTVTLTFANTPTVFMQGGGPYSIKINVTNNSTTTAADSSLNLSLTLPTGVTATSLAGANPTGTGWICSVSTLSCNRTTSLPAGASDPLLLGVSIAANAPLGNANVPVTISGGGLSSNTQCGRVLYNDYHVETGATAGEQYPKECQTSALTAQEKFLEYSLYNLSNFVAPVTTDVIDIQALTTLTWTTPAAIYYGTPLSATQLDAAASAPGTFVYTPPAGTILPVGNDTLNVTFTPTDPTSYTGAIGSTTITVLQDTTTTNVSSSLNPSVVGQAVTFTATVVGNAAAPSGAVSFYDGTTLLGTGTLSASTGDASSATFTTTSLIIGSHSITAVYAATTDFGASTSPVLTQNVLGASTITITGLVSPIDYGQVIGATASINVVGSSTGGTTTTYINGVAVCTLPVAPGLTTICPASTGAGYPVGTYTIYAVFSGDGMYAGSTSPTYTVQIVPDSTTSTLTSSLNPSYFGNSVTFTATIAAPYATPTGPVIFYDGTTALGTVTLSPQGTNQAVAAYSTTALAIGNHNITASYAATTNFAASTSSTLSQVVLPPLPLNGLPGFIMTITPTTLNAFIGANNAISVNINEVNGYSQPITLSCSGLPTEASCGIPQTVVPAGGGTVTMYIIPASPHSCTSNTPYFVASSRSNDFIWMSGFAFILFFVRKRRRLLKALALVLTLCALPILNGCADGCTDFGTKPGTYSFTITGTPPSNTTISGNPYTAPQSQTVTFTAVL
jgi:hypothetical protein